MKNEFLEKLKFLNFFPKIIIFFEKLQFFKKYSFCHIFLSILFHKKFLQFYAKITIIGIKTQSSDGFRKIMFQILWKMNSCTKTNNFL